MEERDHRLAELAALGFEEAADAYERGRPAYPSSAIDFLVEQLGIDGGSVLVDLAAGTGKLARSFLGTGATIVAVEPLEGMRRKLVEMVPQAEVRQGTAEAIPLPDASVDVVVCGQAFHWFASHATLREIHRVLRGPTSGGLGLMWNVRDRSVDWVARLYEIIDEPAGARSPAHRYGSGLWRRSFEETELFTALQERSFPHRQVARPQTIQAQVASLSFIGAMPEAQRQEVLDRVGELLATHPATGGQEQIVLLYETRVYWCRSR